MYMYMYDECILSEIHVLCIVLFSDFVCMHLLSDQFLMIS